MEKLDSTSPASLEPRPLRLSVIVPVRDGGEALGECRQRFGPAISPPETGSSSWWTMEAPIARPSGPTLRGCGRAHSGSPGPRGGPQPRRAGGHGERSWSSSTRTSASIPTCSGASTSSSPPSPGSERSSGPTIPRHSPPGWYRSIATCCTTTSTRRARARPRHSGRMRGDPMRSVRRDGRFR